MARISKAEHLVRVLDQLLEPGLERMFLLAMLVVGSEQREYIASDSPVSGLDARHGIRPDAGSDGYRPWLNVDLFRIAFPFSMVPADLEKLLGVCPRSLAELARKACQMAFVLHVE